MKEFKLPKLWFIEGDDDRPDVKNEWNNLYHDQGQSNNYAFYEGCYYFLNEKGRKSYQKGDAPYDYVRITLDEFMKYVVFKEPIKPFIQDSEYNQILIKLLS